MGCCSKRALRTKAGTKLRQCAYEPIVLLLHCNYLLYVVVLDTTNVRAPPAPRAVALNSAKAKAMYYYIGFPILLEKGKLDKAVIA